jgi:hypothetical protein
MSEMTDLEKKLLGLERDERALFLAQELAGHIAFLEGALASCMEAVAALQQAALAQKTFIEHLVRRLFPPKPPAAVN